MERILITSGSQQGLDLLAKVMLNERDRLVFVPGDPFYVGRDNMNTLRLNFSCVDEQTITTGIRRLGEALEETLDRPAAAFQ